MTDIPNYLTTYQRQVTTNQRIYFDFDPTGARRGGGALRERAAQVAERGGDGGDEFEAHTKRPHQAPGNAPLRRRGVDEIIGASTSCSEGNTQVPV